MTGLSQLLTATSRRLRQTRVIAAFLLAAVFLAGAAAGAATNHILESRDQPEAVLEEGGVFTSVGDPAAARTPTDVLQDRLDLTAEQRRQAEEIIGKRRLAVESVLEQLEPDLQAQRDSADREIRSLLTSEQAAEFRRIVADAPTSGQPDQIYEVSELDSPPSITNMAQIQSVMARLYPRLLLDAGIGGTVELQFVVQPDGSVDPTSIHVMSATNERLSAPSVEALQLFRFRPGRYRGQPVHVMIQMPITWQPAR